MKKIVLPTDFSETAMNAIRYAVKLFENDLCRFYILHAYQQDVYESDVLITKENLHEVTKTANENSQIHLKKALKQIKKLSSNPKHNYKIMSANNILVDEVDEIVEERDIDLVVMGTHGKTNNSKLTFGSHTLQVLKYIKCPVLVIPKGYKYKVPKEIVFSTDFSMPYQQRELDFLSEIASDYQAQIDVLYVSELKKLSLREEKNKHFIEESFKNNKTSFITVDGKNIIDTIRTFVENHPTDLLVMINRRHSFLENILFQDTINKMGLSIDIPFFVLQNINRK
ncbi:universal stress protein [Polaribacter vadi]|uniref:universal stress protein n=1 Tax=Polaribacter vadi TaxID=1774273 RepID=UPI0030ED8AFB|tara:strand:+ start:18375 stop:19223 length:849 start_codon:yes stop_codon:yes gene_type:complete